jgi:2-haloacid dehalogenase
VRRRSSSGATSEANPVSHRWVTFDCYGTLIDWERGIVATLARLWPDADSDTLLASYHEIEPQVQREGPAPYRDILGEVLRRVAATEGLVLPQDEGDALARSLPEWPPFPEVPEALREIRRRGWRTALLSNTDPDLLEASIGLIGLPTDARITFTEAGSYKPARGHWDRFFAETDADPSLHVHVAASIFHDIEPANALGLRAVWVNRAGGTSGVPRAAEIPDLSGLPDVLDELVPGRS